VRILNDRRGANSQGCLNRLVGRLKGNANRLSSIPKRTRGGLKPTFDFDAVPVLDSPINDSHDRATELGDVKPRLHHKRRGGTDPWHFANCDFEALDGFNWPVGCLASLGWNHHWDPAVHDAGPLSAHQQGMEQSRRALSSLTHVDVRVGGVTDKRIRATCHPFRNVGVKIECGYDGHRRANAFTDARKHASVQVIVVTSNPSTVKGDQHPIDRTGASGLANPGEKLPDQRISVIRTHGPTGGCPRHECGHDFQVVILCDIQEAGNLSARPGKG
jgi:hypothetical protein